MMHNNVENYLQNSLVNPLKSVAQPLVWSSMKWQDVGRASLVGFCKDDPTQDSNNPKMLYLHGEKSFAETVSIGKIFNPLRGSIAVADFVIFGSSKLIGDCVGDYKLTAKPKRPSIALTIGLFSAPFKISKAGLSLVADLDKLPKILNESNFKQESFDVCTTSESSHHSISLKHS
jgi:hypothetical protein